MQTKEQIKNWKVVASVATVAAFGVSGLVIASPSDADTPPPIEIQDQRTIGGTSTPTTLGQLEVVPGPAFTPGVDSLDTPLATATVDSPAVDSPSTDSPAPTPAPGPAANDSPSVDSPSADSPAPAPAPAPADDSPSVDSPSVDSPGSTDSGDSLDS
jgi:hypothetical protein